MTKYCDYDYELNSTHHNKDNLVTVLNSKWRVKLYYLNEDGQWDDKGTGNVQIIKKVN